ncbi:hypothetical protein D3C73_1468220 [compost metagenome]
MIIRQAWPGQVHQRIDAVAQLIDVQLRVMQIGGDEIDLAEPRHGLSRLQPTCQRTHPVPARQ